MSNYDFLLIALWFVIATCPAFAQQATDPNLAGGLNGHGSKLAPNDAILIQAPVAITLPANPAGSSVCYAVKNSSNNTYFVPWNTPQEWSAFLGAIGASSQLTAQGLGTAPAITPWITNVAVDKCCPQKQIGDICSTNNTTITSQNYLGYRYLGTPGGDQPLSGIHQAFKTRRYWRAQK